MNHMWPITVNNVMGQSEIGANVCNRHQAREKRVNYVIIISFSLFALNARKKGRTKDKEKSSFSRQSFENRSSSEFSSVQETFK